MPTITSKGTKPQVSQRKLKVIAENKEPFERDVVSVPDIEHGLPTVGHPLQAPAPCLLRRPTSIVLKEPTPYA